MRTRVKSKDKLFRKITVDVPEEVAVALAVEADENKRSRKAQIEVILEQHTEKSRKRNGN